LGKVANIDVNKSSLVLLLHMIDILRLLKIAISDMIDPNLDGAVRYKITLEKICNILSRRGLLNTLVKICEEEGKPRSSCIRYASYLKHVLYSLAKYCPSINYLLRLLEKKRATLQELMMFLEEVDKDIDWYRPQIERVRKHLY